MPPLPNTGKFQAGIQPFSYRFKGTVMPSSLWVIVVTAQQANIVSLAGSASVGDFARVCR